MKRPPVWPKVSVEITEVAHFGDESFVQYVMETTVRIKRDETWYQVQQNRTQVIDKRYYDENPGRVASQITTMFNHDVMMLQLFYQINPALTNGRGESVNWTDPDQRSEEERMEAYLMKV